MDINFELYKVFYEVANEKSISKGAEKLMISQPAVTKAIKTLENQLNGKLFIRTPKGVLLTNEGEQFYEYIKEGMNYFINGTNKFTSLKNLDSGVLNIGCSTTVAEHFLMPYLEDFHAKYPNVAIRIYNDLTDNLIKDLRNGNLDLLVGAIPKNTIKDIQFEWITDLNDIFAGTKEYYEKKYASLEELLEENILLPQAPSVTRIHFNDYLKANRLACTPKMEVVSHSLLSKLAEKGFGVALLTKELIQDKLNHTLYEIPVSIKIPKRKLGYAIKSNSIPSFTTAKLIELLKK